MKLRAGVPAGLGLLLLSALWAGGWVVAESNSPSGAHAASLAVGQAILFSTFAAMAALVAWIRRVEYPRGRDGWMAAGVGVGLFVIPAGAAALAGSTVSRFDEVAVLCLTPVFAGVLEPYLQNSGPRRGKAALAGALTAVAGILCFFPLEAPGSLRGGVALGALLVTALEVAAANCLAVRLASSAPRRSTLTMAAPAGAASALCFAITAALTQSRPGDLSELPIYLPKLFLIDLPGLFLLFWLMPRLSASRMTARFVLAPLFASVAGLALLERMPPLRGLLGLALLAGGSGWIVFAPAESEAEEGVSLKAILGEAPGRPLREE